MYQKIEDYIITMIKDPVNTRLLTLTIGSGVLKWQTGGKAACVGMRSVGTGSKAASVGMRSVVDLWHSSVCRDEECGRLVAKQRV